MGDLNLFGTLESHLIKLACKFLNVVKNTIFKDTGLFLSMAFQFIYCFSKSCLYYIFDRFKLCSIMFYNQRNKKSLQQSSSSKIEKRKKNEAHISEWTQ